MQVKNRPFEEPTVYVPTEPFYGMLGLARRAGKVTPGTPSVLAQLKKGAKIALAEGVTPPIYISGNVEGGRDHNRVLENQFFGRVKHL